MYRIWVIGGSGSGKTNTLLILTNEQNDIDKIYSYARDLNGQNYKILIKKRKDAGIKHINDPNVFIECSNTMDDVYENTHDYDSSRKRKILIKILNKKNMQNEAQYDLDRKAAKISVLSSNNLDKYEYLTGEDLGLKPSTVEQAKFEYSPLGKLFNKGLDKDDIKEGLFKRLENNKDKNEEQLQAIKDQGEKQLKELKNIDKNKTLKAISEISNNKKNKIMKQTNYCLI